MGGSERIVITCEVATKHRFQRFAVPFDDQEAALLELLEEWDREPEEKPTAATQ